MTKLTHIRTAALAAMAAGVVFAVGGFIQLTDSQSSQTTVVGIEHLGLATFTAYLVLLIPVVAFLAKLAGRTRVPVAVPIAGLACLALLTVTSNVRGEDLGIFPFIAIPTNLMIFAGLIALGVALKRNGTFPRAMAIALPLTWIFGLPLSSVGGMVVAGAYWFALGWMLDRGELPLPAIAARA
jgi:hypothetical protein